MQSRGMVNPTLAGISHVCFIQHHGISISLYIEECIISVRLYYSCDLACMAFKEFSLAKKLLLDQKTGTTGWENTRVPAITEKKD